MLKKTVKNFNYSALIAVFLFGIALLCSSAKAGQTHSAVTYTPVCKIPLNGGSFTTDNLQNIYIYSGNMLKKYSATGKLLYRHSDPSYGNITYLDVTDPMKIMVFYKDFPEIVFLDNTLSINGAPISPTDLNYPIATLACTSHSNGLWLYDAQGFQLVRLDRNLAVTQKTGNLIQLLGMQINPDYLIEYNNYVYMNSPLYGILVFDQYGTYYKTIPFKGLHTFEVRGNALFYNRGNVLHIFHLKAITEDTIELPDKQVSLARIEKNMLFESSNDTLKVYNIKNY